MRRHRLAIIISLAAFVLTATAQAAEPEWVEPMKKVHAHFTGTPGALALFGDSITVSMAFWAPLRGEPKSMPEEMAAAHKLVVRHF